MSNLKTFYNNEKLKLLNGSEMTKVQGGQKCTNAGDTIICGFGQNIVLCVTHELKCPSKFTYECDSLKSYSVQCNVTIGPKPKS